MGFSLPLGPILSIGDGARPDDPPRDPPQIALPRDQQEAFPFQEVAPCPPFPCRSKSKCFLKPSVLHVEAGLLEKVFGECAGICRPAPPRSRGPTRGRPLRTYGRVWSPAGQDLSNLPPIPPNPSGALCPTQVRTECSCRPSNGSSKSCSSWESRTLRARLKSISWGDTGTRSAPKR